TPGQSRGEAGWRSHARVRLVPQPPAAPGAELAGALRSPAARANGAGGGGGGESGPVRFPDGMADDLLAATPDEVQARCPLPVDVPAYYATLARRGLEYGAAYRLLRRASAGE